MNEPLESWDELAAALNVPVRELYRERKLPGAPEGRSLAAWQEYYQAKDRVDLQGLTPTTYDASIQSGKLALEGALVHARVVEQEIINERRREELRRVRGDVIPKEKVEGKLRAVAAIALEVLDVLPELAAAAAEPGKRPEARRLAKEWVAALRTQMADRLRLAAP